MYSLHPSFIILGINDSVLLIKRDEIKRVYQDGVKMLAVVKRQGFINSEFKMERLVIEDED